MSDNLKWMNRHAVLLREPQWAGIAARENYKIRADLRPLFDAHPDSLELLDAMAAQGLHREGCEFIARMTHRRAAVWWGYCCFLDLLEERHDVEVNGAPPRLPEELETAIREAAEKAGIPLPALDGALDDIDQIGKQPEIDFEKLLATPVPPPQDAAPLKAASAAVKAKTDAIRSRLPPAIAARLAASKAKADAELVLAIGVTPEQQFAAAEEMVRKSPLTYTVQRADSPHIRKLLQMRDSLEQMRQATIAQIKAAFPEKYPATPEAKMLLAAEKKRKSDDAVQAVWRWIVSPDERNTTLALQAGNEAPGTAEGMLAFTAAWSFGDLAPEGKMTVPVPPELPGTGLNSALLMMSLDQGGKLKMPERYARYFKLGMDVVFGKNLWTEAVSEKLSPHAKLEEKFKGGAT